jgi:hypothetical protein
MNTQLLQDFESKASIVNEQISTYRKTPVHLSNVRKSGQKFFYGQTPVADTALKDLLNIFSIKEKLVEEIKDDKDQWEPLQVCLSNIKKERAAITAVRNGVDGDGSIVRFFDVALEEERPLELDKGLSLMHSYLSDKEDNIKIQGLYFNPQTLQIETQIRHLENKIDTFGDGQDLWDSGFGFNYGEGKTQILPYFLRLICTNGMTATHMVNQRYFQSRELKQNSFTKLINKVLDEDLTGTVRANCGRLKSTNASLREFYNARNILMGRSAELAKTYFDDGEIKEAYREEKLRYKNKRWLASANSNVNAYDFFNRLTHCTSHASLDDITRLQLNHGASEIFFKGPDFAYRAPDPFANRQ